MAGLIDRLLAVADDPAPQIRAVVTTLLIKALDDPAEGEMIRLMVGSDAAEIWLHDRGNHELVLAASSGGLLPEDLDHRLHGLAFTRRRAEDQPRVQRWRRAHV